MTVISSKELNDGFAGIQSDLVTVNRNPTNEKNLTFNFDCVQLIQSGFYNDDVSFGGVTYTPVQEQENLEQIFRIYDDVQVIGIMVDAWGIGRAGLSGINLETNNAPGGEPSRALSFNVKILGNYTNLDDEKGYPAIYKSTEFNLVNDFNIVFSDHDAVQTSFGVLFLGDNFTANSEYSTPFLGTKKRMPSRQTFFPISEEGGTQILHGGAEYIITLNGLNEKGVPQEGQEVAGQTSLAFHLTTAMQLTLVCRTFRRRFG